MKMTPIEAVHTFARRCCIDRLAELKQQRYRAKAEGTDKDIAYSSRRATVEVILVEVERFTPADFRSHGHAALRLIEAAQIAQNYLTQQKMWQQPPYTEAMQQERDRFAKALHQFAAQKDWKRWSVEPLPYRRTLRDEESQRLMPRLRERWGITGKWWLPFEKHERRYDTMVLDSQAVGEKLGYATLRQILAHWDILCVYELWEAGQEPSRELEVALWEPASLWSERYWCTDALDWLIYTTHENSTTIAGDWLLCDIKAAWPDWEAHQWIAPWSKQE